MMRDEQDEDAARVIGSVGSGLDITGLTIAQSPTSEQLQQWSDASVLEQAGESEELEPEMSDLTPAEPVIAEEPGGDTAG